MTLSTAFWRRGLLGLAIASSTLFAGATPATETTAATALFTKYTSLEGRLRENQFSRPVVLDSAETANQVKGEIYAVVDHPFEDVSTSLKNPNHWCDVMSLHINTKYCKAVAGPSGTVLKVNIGKKTPQDLADAPRVDFTYGVVEGTPQFFDVRLSAKNGPLGTSDYRIELKMIPLAKGKSFLHLTYSYAMNFSARLGMQAYLATVGSEKVGFTQVSNTSSNPPEYVGGVRALVERNTMRYYLAINSFLESANEPGPTQLDKRLQSWFTAAEKYPRQLHEVERGPYIAMKHDEYLRQQTAD
jgi:hypothetical protein